MVYFQKMTPEGYKQIEDEIASLKKDRPRRIKILQAAVCENIGGDKANRKNISG